MTWAQRLKQVFGIDIDTCSLCAGVVKIMTSIEDPAVAVKILSHLEKKNTDPDKVNLPENRATPQFFLS
jgi:23S rRNA U2552 (ribose-2'-O)-methylase RlmE/FtsJ